MNRRRTIALTAVIVFAVGVVGVALLSTGGSDDNDKTSPAALPKLARPSSAADSKDSKVGGPSGEPAMAAAFFTDYVVKGTLPTLPGTAPAYRLPAPSRDDVVALAAKLGLHGEVTGAATSFTVADGDHQLTVMDRGDGWFWQYSDQPASGGAVGVVSSSGTAIACPARPCPSDMACAAVCPQPPPPPDLPNRDEAERLGRAFLSKVGVDLTHARVQMNDGYTVWSIVADPEVGGLPTNYLSTMVTIGPKGVIQNASGFLGTPAKIGNYPLVGVDAGLERLKSGTWWWGGPRPLAAVDGQGQSVPPPAKGAPTASGQPVPAPPAPPAPQPPAPQPEPLPNPMPRRTVTITGVHLALVPDRQATLQPAYVFETEGDIGMITPIPAVQDQFLAP